MTKTNNTKSALATFGCMIACFGGYVLLAKFGNVPFTTVGSIVAAVIGVGAGIALDKTVFAE